jgi:hypothetical protein
MLGDSTAYVAWMSLTRQVAATACIVLAGSYFGIAGVASGLLAGTVFTWAGLLNYAWRLELRPRHFLTTLAGLQFLAVIILLGTSLLRLA